MVIAAAWLRLAVITSCRTRVRVPGSVADRVCMVYMRDRGDRAVLDTAWHKSSNTFDINWVPCLPPLAPRWVVAPEHSLKCATNILPNQGRINGAHLRIWLRGTGKCNFPRRRHLCGPKSGRFSRAKNASFTALRLTLP